MRPRFYFLAGFTIVIALLSSGATIFSWSCVSDGCIGVAMLGGVAAVVYLVQVLLFIPVCTFFKCRDHLQPRYSALVWVAISTIAFFAPMLFLKGGISSAIWILEVAQNLA